MVVLLKLSVKTGEGRGGNSDETGTTQPSREKSDSLGAKPSLVVTKEKNEIHIM